MRDEFDSEEYEDLLDLDDDTEPPGWDERTGRSLPRGKMTFEGVLGLFAAFFIGLPAPFMAGVAVAHLVPGAGILMGVPAFFAAGYLSVLVVKLASRATEGDHGSEAISGSLVSVRRLEEHQALRTQETADSVVVPLAIAMAIRLPNWPVLCRPFIGVWWLAHFSAAAFIGHAIAVNWLNRMNNANWAVAVPFTLLATFAFLFAGNLYLMLAVAACVKRPGVWLIVWRHRFFVDLILAAFMLFAAA